MASLLITPLVELAQKVDEAFTRLELAKAAYKAVFDLEQHLGDSTTMGADALVYLRSRVNGYGEAYKGYKDSIIEYLGEKPR